MSLTDLQIEKSLSLAFPRGLDIQVIKNCNSDNDNFLKKESSIELLEDLKTQLILLNTNNDYERSAVKQIKYHLNNLIQARKND